MNYIVQLMSVYALQILTNWNLKNYNWNILFGQLKFH